MAEWGFDFLRQFEVQDNALVIRRFIVDWKFRDLIEKQSLYFSPASEFTDLFEGHHFRTDHGEWHRNTVRELSKDSNGMVCIECHNQKAVVICCWTGEPREKSHFWCHYGESRDAVALESSVGRLRGALGSGFLIVPVEYRPFPGEPLPKDHSLQPYFYKRTDYHWEQEVRVVGEMEPGARIPSPRCVKIDLASVVKRIIISPCASRNYRETVEAMLNAASLSIPVYHSVLRAKKNGTF